MIGQFCRDFIGCKTQVVFLCSSVVIGQFRSVGKVSSFCSVRWLC